MEESFKIEVRRNANGETVEFYGTIDARAEQQFDDLFCRLSASRLVFDFSRAGRINSMGIAFLLRSIKRIKVEKNAAVSVSGLNQVNAMLFKMTGIFMLAPEVKSANS
ncbi:STAS domain-containing protein [Geobacter sp. SVR]|uniref:STAS domain-containing protein n=1 Tax=Geobacter sp. SVR TaxID=2495594 RepID=UPI00143EFC5D|nr:STAS domain-containing protein [Geobacter sp. SVR]BCS55939.1 hypothetical protein GSVR_42470 [Geobacter sp. SVR]GCF84702.1 hypothetical protein GSbR_13020 [Geobacter sp. SVR]